MGKTLIIKNADFSNVAITRVVPTEDSVIISTHLTQSIGYWYPNGNYNSETLAIYSYELIPIPDGIKSIKIIDSLYELYPNYVLCFSDFQQKDNMTYTNNYILGCSDFFDWGSYNVRSEEGRIINLLPNTKYITFVCKNNNVNWDMGDSLTIEGYYQSLLDDDRWILLSNTQEQQDFYFADDGTKLTHDTIKSVVLSIPNGAKQIKIVASEEYVPVYVHYFNGVPNKSTFIGMRETNTSINRTGLAHYYHVFEVPENAIYVSMITTNIRNIYIGNLNIYYRL